MGAEESKRLSTQKCHDDKCQRAADLERAAQGVRDIHLLPRSSLSGAGGGRRQV